MEQSGPYEHTPAQAAAAERHLVVAQATGILMSRFTLTADDALEKLFAEANDRARPVVEVSREIVAGVGGSAPGQATSGTVARELSIPWGSQPT